MVQKDDIIQKGYTCKRCGHKWIPRSDEKPTWCPNNHCHSPKWDLPK